MKRFATLFAAVSLATAGTAALADQDQLNKQAAKPQLVKMTDAQLDNVAGGALVAAGNLVSVQVQDVVSDNNINVAVPVTAAVGAAVGVLSGPQVAAARSGDQAVRFGRQFQ